MPSAILPWVPGAPITLVISIFLRNFIVIVSESNRNLPLENFSGCWLRICHRQSFPEHLVLGAILLSTSSLGILLQHFLESNLNDSPSDDVDNQVGLSTRCSGECRWSHILNQHLKKPQIGKFWLLYQTITINHPGMMLITKVPRTLGRVADSIFAKTPKYWYSIHFQCISV